VPLIDNKNELLLVTAVLTGLRKIGPSNFKAIYEGLGGNRTNMGQVNQFAQMIARCHVCGWITNPMDSHDGLTLSLTEQGEAKADELVELLEAHGLDLDGHNSMYN
jgi:hypothetical protein